MRRDMTGYKQKSWELFSVSVKSRMRKIPPYHKKQSLLIKVPNKSNIQGGKLPQLPNVVGSARIAEPSNPSSHRPHRDMSELPFQGPVKPSFIFMNFPKYLTEREESEILQYREIFYLRPNPPSSRKTSNQIPNFFHYVQNEHIAYRYQQIQVIGKGSFGSVLECIDHKTGEKVAIKMLRDKPKVHSQIIFELDLLKQLQSDDPNDDHNIIKYIESFVFRGFFCIVMELVSLDIYTVLKMQRFIGFQFPTVQMVAKKSGEALKFIHDNGIIHADIKPENILFTDTTQTAIKMIDFGCSCFIGKIMFSYIQSRYYRAPEVVLGIEYGTEIDIWSLGCVLCEMITGRPLFPAEDETELIQMMAEVLGMPPSSLIKHGPRSHHYFDEKGQMKVKPNSKGKHHIAGTSSVSLMTQIKEPMFLSLIDGCLKWNPKDRFTANDVINHPWVKQSIRDDHQVPKSARV